MEYRVVTEASALKATLTGKLTVNDHSSFRKIITMEAVKPGSELELDMSGVDFIDSAGLGMLLYAEKQSKANGWHLAVKGPQGQVRKMIELGKLDQVLDVRF